MGEYRVRCEIREFPDYQGIVSDELFKAAIRTQNTWRNNLQAGKGEKGSHGRPYVGTGEAIARTTLYPETPGAMAYLVAGETIQHLIAEFGRRPGAPPPPFEPISRWAREAGLRPAPGQTWTQMINIIRFAIGRRGLRAFAPMAAAVNTVGPTVEPRIERRIRDGEAKARAYRQGLIDR